MEIRVSEGIIEFRPEFELFEAEYKLPIWANFCTEESSDDFGGDITFLLYPRWLGVQWEKKVLEEDIPTYTAAMEWFLKHQPEIQSAALSAIHNYIIDVLIGEYEFDRDDEDLSEYKSESQLKDMIALSRIRFFPQMKSDLPYFSLDFDCNWDPEHGCGVMFHGTQVLETGSDVCENVPNDTEISNNVSAQELEKNINPFIMQLTSAFASASEKQKSLHLNQDQIAVVEKIAAEWINQIFRVDPISEADAQQAISAAYKAQKLTPPHFEFCQSPWQVMERVRGYAPALGAADAVASDAKGILSMLAGYSDVFAGVLGAQPRKWPALGEEMDLVADHIFQFATEEVASSIVPPKIRKDIEKLNDLSNAVEFTLTDKMKGADVSWAVYCVSSIASMADEFVRHETVAQLNLAELDQHRLQLSKNVLFCAWSVYAFEKVCFVCDRPIKIIHPVFGTDRKDKLVKVIFRDNFEAQLDLALIG